MVSAFIEVKFKPWTLFLCKNPRDKFLLGFNQEKFFFSSDGF